MVDAADKLSELAGMVPKETVALFAASKMDSEAERLAADMATAGTAELHLDEAELVAYRLRELNKIASDLQDAANERGKALREWSAWAARLRATLNAQPTGQPYSRAMVDSVMFDCPLKVEG